MITRKIEVFGRIKPASEHSKIKDFVVEEGSNNDTIIYSNAKHPTLSRAFRFRKVFQSPSSTQEDVFECAAKPVLENLLIGYSGTIFAYGQTGTGKTYTMTGDFTVYEERGIIPRTIQFLFHSLKETSTVTISYFEIYNEHGYDLIGFHPSANAVELQQVNVLEDAKGNLHFRNLSSHTVRSVQEALDLLLVGDGNRMVAETANNLRSSRSHTIFLVTLESVDPCGNGCVRSTLHLVDLAGSERLGKSSSSLINSWESRYINLSLHYLEQVLVALGESGRTHIPYRNSLMTTVLKNSLGGNCCTCMIATLSSEDKDFEETIQTCRFSQRVALVRTEAKINEVLDINRQIRQLKRENAYLKSQLRELQAQRMQGFDDHTDDLLERDKSECCEWVKHFIADPDLAVLPLNDIRKAEYCFNLMREEILKQKPTSSNRHAYSPYSYECGKTPAAMPGTYVSSQGVSTTVRRETISVLQRDTIVRKRRVAADIPRINIIFKKYKSTDGESIVPSRGKGRVDDSGKDGYENNSTSQPPEVPAAFEKVTAHTSQCSVTDQHVAEIASQESWLRKVAASRTPLEIEQAAGVCECITPPTSIEDFEEENICEAFSEASSLHEDVGPVVPHVPTESAEVVNIDLEVLKESSDSVSMASGKNSKGSINMEVANKALQSGSIQMEVPAKESDMTNVFLQNMNSVTSGPNPVMMKKLSEDPPKMSDTDVPPELSAKASSAHSQLTRESSESFGLYSDGKEDSEKYSATSEEQKKEESASLPGELSDKPSGTRSIRSQATKESSESFGLYSEGKDDSEKYSGRSDENKKMSETGSLPPDLSDRPSGSRSANSQTTKASSGSFELYSDGKDDTEEQDDKNYGQGQSALLSGLKSRSQMTVMLANGKRSGVLKRSSHSICHHSPTSKKSWESGGLRSESTKKSSQSCYLNSVEPKKSSDTSCQQSDGTKNSWQSEEPKDGVCLQSEAGRKTGPGHRTETSKKSSQSSCIKSTGSNSSYIRPDGTVRIAERPSIRSEDLGKMSEKPSVRSEDLGRMSEKPSVRIDEMPRVSEISSLRQDDMRRMSGRPSVRIEDTLKMSERPSREVTPKMSERQSVWSEDPKRISERASVRQDELKRASERPSVRIEDITKPSDRYCVRPEDVVRRLSERPSIWSADIKSMTEGEKVPSDDIKSRVSQRPSNGSQGTSQTDEPCNHAEDKKDSDRPEETPKISQRKSVWAEDKRMSARPSTHQPKETQKERKSVWAEDNRTSARQSTYQPEETQKERKSVWAEDNSMSARPSTYQPKESQKERKSVWAEDNRMSARPSTYQPEECPKDRKSVWAEDNRMSARPSTHQPKESQKERKSVWAEDNRMSARPSAYQPEECPKERKSVRGEDNRMSARPSTYQPEETQKERKSVWAEDNRMSARPSAYQPEECPKERKSVRGEDNRMSARPSTYQPEETQKERKSVWTEEKRLSRRHSIFHPEECPKEIKSVLAKDNRMSARPSTYQPEETQKERKSVWAEDNRMSARPSTYQPEETQKERKSVWAEDNRTSARPSTYQPEETQKERKSVWAEDNRTSARPSTYQPEECPKERKSVWAEDNRTSARPSTYQPEESQKERKSVWAEDNRTSARPSTYQPEECPKERKSVRGEDKRMSARPSAYQPEETQKERKSVWAEDNRMSARPSTYQPEECPKERKSVRGEDKTRECRRDPAPISRKKLRRRERAFGQKTRECRRDPAPISRKRLRRRERAFGQKTAECRGDRAPISRKRPRRRRRDRVFGQKT
ncbi:UNVERIFIED_CONTAM: hypothetical protein PYX00_008153 [Menopon gallinae]|uniref:Kinesin motor domain-containing protein n=2 Tax=Menopon gallinae TaxID=328185 RepID=A0AAW2HN65_9NEOP